MFSFLPPLNRKPFLPFSIETSWESYAHYPGSYKHIDPKHPII